MNIGKEKLYIKFKLQEEQIFTVYDWIDCRVPIQNDEYYDYQEIKIETSIFDPKN